MACKIRRLLLKFSSLINFNTNLNLQMPNTKSAAKAMRQSVRRKEFNLRTKDLMKSAVKEARRMIKAGDKSKAAEALRKAMSALDKAAKKNVITKNNAARKKSRLAKALAK